MRIKWLETGGELDSIDRILIQVFLRRLTWIVRCIESDIHEKRLRFVLSDGKKGKAVFLKDTYVASRMSAVAESMVLPNEGSLEEFKRLDWKPFGAGPHACPGRALAEFEFKEFFDALKSGYKITLDPEQRVPKRVGLISLQLTEDIFINIKKNEA